MTKYYLGQKCFYYLVEKESRTCLENYIGDSFEQFIIVKFKIPRIGTTLYTYFDDYISLFNYMNKFSEKNRHFFEVVPEDYFQKPRFDLDIDVSKLQSLLKQKNVNLFDNFVIVQNLVKTIILVFKEYYNIDISIKEDILIFSSHSKEKISYHIVIDNYCHSNYKEAKQFYKLIIKYMPENINFLEKDFYKVFIDRGVYGRNQNFRIVGSTKFHQKRTKKLLNCWNFENKTINTEWKSMNKEHKKLITLNKSLLTNTFFCKILPDIVVNEKFKKYNIQNILNLNNEIVNQAFEILINYNEKNNIPSDAFKINGVNDPFISLKREKSTYCKVCKRIHENENPFLIIIQDKNYENTMNIYFGCRRDEKNIIIGQIKKQKFIDDNNSNNEEQKNIEHESTEQYFIIENMFENEDKKEFNISHQNIKHVLSQKNVSNNDKIYEILLKNIKEKDKSKNKIDNFGIIVVPKTQSIK